MYIYEAKNLVVEISGEDAVVNGVILTPEKDGKDPFTPAQEGDTCVVIYPDFDVVDDEEFGAVQCVENYSVAFDKNVTPINEGCKLFAFQGDVVGTMGGDGGKIRGLIFKAVRNQCEMNPELKDGEFVYVIGNEVFDGTEWTELPYPARGLVEVDSSAMDISIEIQNHQGETITELDLPQDSTLTITAVANKEDVDFDFEVTAGSDLITISADKDECEVTGVDKGEAEITITATAGSMTATTVLPVIVAGK